MEVSCSLTTRVVPLPGVGRGISSAAQTWGGISFAYSVRPLFSCFVQ